MGMGAFAEATAEFSRGVYIVHITAQPLKKKRTRSTVMSMEA